MLPRMIRTSVLLLATVANLPGARAQQTSPLPSQFDGGLTTLDGKWAFHLGDNPAWATPSFNDSAWEKLTPDAPWGDQGHFATVGYGWYRWHLHLGPGSPTQLAIFIPAVEDAYEVYWNGRLVGSYGKLPPHPVWYVTLRPHTWGLGQATDGILAIRAWKCPFNSFDPGNQGGFYAPPLLGSPQAIANTMAASDYRWLRGLQFRFALDALYTLVALTGLLMWIRDRSQWLAFWMACFAAAKPLATLLLGLKIPISEVLAMGLNQPVYVLGDISLWFVLLWLLDLNSDRRIFRFARILAIIEALEGLIDGCDTFGLTLSNPFPWQILDGALMPIVMALEFFPFYLIFIAIRRRRQLHPARWAVAILAFIFQTFFVVSVSLRQFSRFTHWTIGSSMNAPLFSILGNRFNFSTLTGTLLLVALVYAVYRYSVENRRLQSLLEQEMRNARAVQQVLVPEAIPFVPGFGIHSVYKPAGEVGGDFFQILPLPNGSVLTVIGDVSGKGMPAAMTVSLLVGTVRTLAHYTQSPGEILSAMNYRMVGRSEGGFTTCLVLRADPGGQITVANAGHIAPYLGGRELPVEGGLPLGLTPGTVYAESTFRLDENKQLTLVTDGVVEARSKSGELFGFDRTASISNNSAKSIALSAESFGQEDDITVLTLTLARQPAAA